MTKEKDRRKQTFQRQGAFRERCKNQYAGSNDKKTKRGNGTCNRGCSGFAQYDCSACKQGVSGLFQLECAGTSVFVDAGGIWIKEMRCL